MATFGERLKKLREEAHLKQEDLAKRLNISTSAYGYYEQGRNEPSLDTLQTLSVLLDTSIDYLIGTSDARKVPEVVQISDQLTLSENEIRLIIELKKYPQLIQDLTTDPEAKVEQLYKLWHFIKNEFHQ